VGDLDGKVVLITGCARARGMGREMATTFARAGADIVATDVVAGGTRNDNEEGLAEIRLGWKGLESLAAEVEGLGRRIATLVGDVSRAADAERMVADAIGRLGRVDVLVNNAAAPHGADRRLLWEVPEDAWDAVLGVNLKGVYLCARAALPRMRRLGGGSIVNMASVNGFWVEPKLGAYFAAKGGVINLTRAIAPDFGKDGIRCNCICPGYIDTGMAQRYFDVQNDPEAARAEAGRLHALGRIGTPEEIAAMALFLCSDESSFCTAQPFIVDGGLSAGVPAA